MLVCKSTHLLLATAATIGETEVDCRHTTVNPGLMTLMQQDLELEASWSYQKKNFFLSKPDMLEMPAIPTLGRQSQEDQVEGYSQLHREFAANLSYRRS